MGQEPRPEPGLLPREEPQNRVWAPSVHFLSGRRHEKELDSEPGRFWFCIEDLLDPAENQLLLPAASRSTVPQKDGLCESENSSAVIRSGSGSGGDSCCCCGRSCRLSGRVCGSQETSQAQSFTELCKTLNELCSNKPPCAAAAAAAAGYQEEEEGEEEGC